MKPISHYPPEFSVNLKQKALQDYIYIIQLILKALTVLCPYSLFQWQSLLAETSGQCTTNTKLCPCISLNIKKLNQSWCPTPYPLIENMEPRTNRVLKRALILM